MNKVKIFIVLLFSMFLSLNAQNNIGKDYYNVNEYELAKKYFLQNLSVNPAEANYYLGEISYSEGDMEAATNYYNQGLQTKLDPYCRIGLAKIDLKAGKKVEAASTFISMQKKYPKEVDILIPIGYAYLDNKIMPEVESLLAEMIKIDKTNPRMYVLEGDKLKVEDKIGQAAGKYEMAIHFDENYAPAYIRIAEVYEKINPQAAIGKLKELLELKPNYTIAYRYLGRIYNSNGYYPSAIDAFKTYFAAENYTLDDISRYASALYFNKNYEEAMAMIQKGLAIMPDHFVLNRLQMYIAANTLNVETGFSLNVETGLQYAKKFFALKNQKDAAFLLSDYTQYALLLKEAKMYDEAMEQYKHALQMDGAAIEIYKEIAHIAATKKLNYLAAEYYSNYITKSGDKVEALDYLQMGKYYYSAGSIRTAADTANILNRHNDMSFISTISQNELQKDSLLQSASLFIEKAVKYYLIQADKAFSMVIEIVPESYQGYLWKARTNSLLDPDSENGLAKPHYEKLLEVIADRDDLKSINLEAYQYLGFYHYIKNDTPNIILYWNKVLELDPENNNAKEVFKHIKQ